VQLTGHLGDVMQESGRAAMTYVTRPRPPNGGWSRTSLSKLEFICMYRRAPYRRTAPARALPWRRPY
jgi:hypothetical protein